MKWIAVMFYFVKFCEYFKVKNANATNTAHWTYRTYGHR